MASFLSSLKNKIGKHDDHCTACPADGIREDDGEERIGDEARHHEQIDLAYADEAGEHADHGSKALAKSAQRSRKHLIERTEEEEGGNGTKEHHGGFNDAFVRVKDRGDRRAEDPDE